MEWLVVTPIPHNKNQVIKPSKVPYMGGDLTPNQCATQNQSYGLAKTIILPIILKIVLICEGSYL